LTMDVRSPSASGGPDELEREVGLVGASRPVDGLMFVRRSVASGGPARGKAA
jgi:hypothetical protein